MRSLGLIWAALAFGASAALAQTDSSAVPPPPEEGGPRHFEVVRVSSRLNLRAEASVTATVIDSLQPGAILSNLGCAEAEGRVWCDVQDYRGGLRGFVAADFLAPAVAPDGSVATGPNDSAYRAGQDDFDATGTLPCALKPWGPARPCGFGVARAGGGDAALVVTKSDGRERAIFFARGIPLSAAAGDGDPDAPGFSATRRGNVSRVRVGDERYDIPDAVITGG